MIVAGFLIAAAVLRGSPAQGVEAQTDSRVCERALGGTAPARDDLAQRLAQATSATQPARASFLRGCDQWAGGHDDKAAAEFEKAAKADTTNAVYQYWLGRVYGNQAQKANVLRQPSLARRTKDHFERAVQLDSNYIDARDGLMQYYLQAPGIVGGSLDKARAQAAEVAKRNAYRGGFETATIAQHEKDTAAVARAYQALIAQFPDSAGPYYSLLNVAGARKDYPLAWRTVEQLQRAQPNNSVALFVLGRVAAESGEQLDKGEQALRDYLKYQPAPNEPNHTNAHWRLGMILEKRGSRDQAKLEYQAALSADPKHKGALDGLARLK
jgi:tetratricopeptide (TPR) repeat protein